MIQLYRNTKDWIVTDWKSNKIRLILELANWILNVTVAIIIAATVPNTPFIILYPLWFACIAISIYSAITRGSIGLLLASLSMLAIDITGFIRLLLQ